MPLLVLDVDGTIRKGLDELGRFVNGPEDVEVFPEAIEMMRRWKQGGGRIMTVSNQGGIALGLLSVAAMKANMEETRRQTDGLIDGMNVCPHHPNAKDPEMGLCWCRKPRGGLVIEGAMILAKAYPEYYPPYMGLFVGDRPEDEAAAMATNFAFKWAKDWRAEANGQSQ